MGLYRAEWECATTVAFRSSRLTSLYAVGNKGRPITSNSVSTPIFTRVSLMIRFCFINKCSARLAEDRTQKWHEDMLDYEVTCAHA